MNNTEYTQWTIPSTHKEQHWVHTMHNTEYTQWTILSTHNEQYWVHTMNNTEYTQWTIPSTHNEQWTNSPKMKPTCIFSLFSQVR